MKTVLFFVRHFTERGTEVAIYDYAKYNEEILHNKSYIVAFTPESNRAHGFCMDRWSYDKFKSRFEILEIEDIRRDMPKIIEQTKADVFYTLTHGNYDIYEFWDKSIWQNCKTIKHCVYSLACPESDYYCSISQFGNMHYNTNYPVIPHIVKLPDVDGNFRKELGIPEHAIVLGRYGCYSPFGIPYVKESIIDSLNRDENLYYLFMNTPSFCDPHPRIIHLERSIDLEYKTKFIQTCDAMLHVSELGETFGLCVAEFSSKNRPIITCNCGATEHIRILNDRAIIYNNKEELDNILANIREIIWSRTDWNAYEDYSPEKVMKLFTLFHDV